MISLLKIKFLVDVTYIFSNILTLNFIFLKIFRSDPRMRIFLFALNGDLLTSP